MRSPKGRLPYAILALILLLSGTLSFLSATQESAIMDELAHIPAGYGYVRYLDYRLNPEHPPLVKALAAFPLLFMRLNFPTQEASWASAINGQWDAGRQFLYEYNDRQADAILLLSRIMPILLSLLLVLIAFLWSRELMGPWWALIPAFFTALSPNILAHGHYVTTDVGAAVGFIGSTYLFTRYLLSPTKGRRTAAGIGLGAALLLKFSLVLVVPLFAILLVIRWMAHMREKSMRLFSKLALADLWSQIISLVLIFLKAVAVIAAVYAILTLGYPMQKQMDDTTAILHEQLAGSLPISSLAHLTIWLSSLPLVRGFGEYMLGVLMVFQRSIGGNTVYFLGSIGNGGWWYYFPVAFLLKETLPALLLIALGLYAACKRIIASRTPVMQRLRDYAILSMPELAILLVIAVYWLYSINSTLNIGFRHILPTVPLLYMLAVLSIKKWTPARLPDAAQPSKKPFLRMLQAGLIGVMGVWLAAESIAAFPYYLSYFNEYGGGIWNGYRYITDSNYDWGQDMKRLAQFAHEHPNEKIAVDYFGGAHAPYYLGAQYIPWDQSKGDPSASTDAAWLAASINTLQQERHLPADKLSTDPSLHYQWITHYEEPYARAGTSIFIYKLK
jgi:4-amino-4-deoxy-L-arabinose transferase-like glycosyltransferase